MLIVTLYCEVFSTYEWPILRVSCGSIQQVQCPNSYSVMGKCTAGNVGLILIVYWGSVQQVQWG